MLIHCHPSLQNFTKHKVKMMCPSIYDPFLKVSEKWSVLLLTEHHAMKAYWGVEV
jgi:hypothetical protein